MKTVLVVDDEYGIAETLQEFLEGEGFAVLTAANGEQALERLREKRADVVLMDIMMPILGGLETLRRIRASEALEHLPVILMSSVLRGSIDESSVALASAFLRKPFKLEPLLETIRQLTGG